MSGIAGFFQRRGYDANDLELKEMLSVSSHRGKDKRLYCCHGPAAIGINLLQTTPQSLFEGIRYKQVPHHWVVSDARLDNRDDLGKCLGLSRSDVQLASDGQLILASYQRWHTACPKYLLGDFSFAIYDERHRTWYCARDQMGTKPFHYYLSKDLFVFASESKTVLAVSGVPPDLNEERIGDFLVSAWLYESESTLFKAIRRLPPAHSLHVTATSSLLSEYWNLGDVAEQKLRSDDDYAEQFRNLFTESVRCRLRSQGPVSTMMSGGVDSSSITCVAHSLVRNEGLPAVQVYSGIADDGWKCRESPYVQALTDYLKIQPRLIRADEMVNYALDMFGLLKSLDDPRNADMLDQRMLAYRFAAEAGSKVMLDGLGGDDVFSFPEPALACLVESGSAWRGIGLSLMMWKSWGGFNFEGAGSAWGASIPAARRWLVPEWAKRAKRKLSALPGPPLGYRKYLINEEFRNKSGVSDRILARFLKYQNVPETIRALSVRVVTEPHLTGAQEMYDNVAAQFGIEPRRPCMDRRLVEFCVDLPVRQKVRRGWNKWILRNSLEGIVPDAVRWRRNIGGILWRSKYLAIKQNPHILAKEIERAPKFGAKFISNDSWNSGLSSWFESDNFDGINDIIDSLALEAFITSLNEHSNHVSEELVNDQRRQS